MQPFGRPVARAAWASSGAATSRISALSSSRFARQGMPRAARPSICKLCRAWAGASTLPRRLYSSQPTPSTSNRPNATPPTENVAKSSAELPSAKDGRRSDAAQKFSHVMDNLQARVLTASQTLNDITGYSAIESIKAENETMETQLSAAHGRVRAARQAYKTSNSKRASTQREVTTLLARKDTWSPSDLERFTELYRTDHELEGEVATAQETLTEAEVDEQSLSQRLNAGILKRYHEEQIWSDRIRQASTWGTWGLMGMNFLLFVVLQLFAEPWRRKRLVKGVVEEEKRVLEEVRGELESVKSALTTKMDNPTVQPAEVSDAPLGAGIAPPPVIASWREVFTDPTKIRAVAADMCSDRRLDLRMRDASTLVLQAALAGAALTGGALLLLR